MVGSFQVSVEVVCASRSEGCTTCGTPKLVFLVVFLISVSSKTSFLRLRCPGELCVGAQITSCHTAT